ncbi:RagB/SusD family nutrient uptake outer membrane protein [Salinibacter sp. 10B]|uniref:RagB/SusD family nutrient uptake outer membrane protein n=1 Tax=Salinibacter sp. 10B TaxID=1923971 RepID=UPI001C612F77|nr:RagB/SusD family nutrient uptake outer membrane protein [Salinibacter sp. 10B]
MLRLLSFLLIAGTLLACDSALDENPSGKLSGDQLNTPDRVEGLVTAAYAALGNGHWDAATYTDPWPWGSVRSDNAYKGGGSVADQGVYNNYEQFSSIRTDLDKADQFWFKSYQGISRANLALEKLAEISEEEFPLKTRREAEVRFIRGHFHFMLKIMFKHVPFIEANEERELKNVSNREFTSQELWDKIAADFQFAADNLPESQPEVGRIDQWAAKAYLAKTRLYQAYRQDPSNHEVVEIQDDKLQTVVSLVNELEASGEYSLFDDIRKNFLWEFDNTDGGEAVFAVQRSRNDGTVRGRVNMENALNYPMNEGFGCCWFHIPSQNFVNAFQTDSDGLPLFDTFNQNSLTEPEDFQQNTVDPRLDHSVALEGHPFKYDNDQIYDPDVWARAPATYGPYTSMKGLQPVGSPSVQQVVFFYASSKNNNVIRYADVLLWKAEALIELGREDEALPIINRIRTRAANSTVKDADGNNVSNYQIEPYRDGQNINWTQANARQALRFERRLELGMEGWRFFDLVRWGIAAETLNEYFATEKQRRDYLQDAQFQEGRDEYLPIPQQQIDFSDGSYQQNPGW